MENRFYAIARGGSGGRLIKPTGRRLDIEMCMERTGADMQRKPAAAANEVD